MLNPDPPTFESVVFAGGGNRCFWHAGFWREVQGPLALAPRQIAAVSAAGAIACAITAGIGEEALRLFQTATRANPRNCYPRNLLGKDPVFPHERMYRSGDAGPVRSAGAGEGARGPGHPRAPRAHAALARPADGLPRRVGRLQLRQARPAGRAPDDGARHRVTGRRWCRCATAPRRRRWPISSSASSCSPPMTSSLRWKGRYVLDGGVVDNVPVCALDDAPRGDAGVADAAVHGAAGHPRAHLCPAVGEDLRERLGLHEPGGDSERVRPGTAGRRGVRQGTNVRMPTPRVNQSSEKMTP